MGSSFHINFMSIQRHNQTLQKKMYQSYSEAIMAEVQMAAVAAVNDTS